MQTKDIHCTFRMLDGSTENQTLVRETAPHLIIETPPLVEKMRVYDLVDESDDGTEAEYLEVIPNVLIRE